MIIRRQLYPNDKLPIMKKSHDSGMELKPIYKKLPQTHANPVKKHVHASSASNSGARDVDNLLTPINHQEKIYEDSQSQSSKERTERNLWRNDEVMEMLYTMQQVKALEKLNDKTIKSENVFKDVEVIMHRNGFKKKSHVQIWTKWKFLKSTYMTSRRNGVIPRMVPPQVYDTIHQMVSGANDSSNSTNCSLDGDGSSVSGMVISGVEGGISNAAVTNDEDEDSFGMAHPIFGFRLGTVKSEPPDTGYETLGNNGTDKDPLGNETSNNSKSDKQVKEELSNTEHKTRKEPELPVQKATDIPHRGRGRPPKNPPVASSTPINTPSPVGKNTQLPPLRVAPFAKQLDSTNAIAANRPPPPLTMPPTPRIRVANLSDLKNGDPAQFAQPKLMPKPTHHQQQSSPVQTIRLPKELTLQTRVTSTPSPSYPKMKQIPMRKTPYSLRPDRAIPDLESSLSPPPPVAEKASSKKIEEVANTKHLIIQSNNSNHVQNNGYRKRRSEWQESSNPVKQPRYSQEEDSPKSEHIEEGKHYSKILQNVIIDLSSSLRKMQTQMMCDFFKKQHELLETEHRFQLQQDRMVMKAFQEQTHEIMGSVKELVNSIRHSRYEQTNERYEHIRESKRNTRINYRDIDENHIEGNEHENNDISDDDEQEERDEDEAQPVVDENEEVYTDNEQDPHHQIENQNENDQVGLENNNDGEDLTDQHVNADHQSQADDHNSDSNDLEETDHAPVHTVSNALLNEN